MKDASRGALRDAWPMKVIGEKRPPFAKTPQRVGHPEQRY